MLRRRKRSSRGPRPQPFAAAAAPAVPAAAAPRTRRRAREGAPVPTELKLDRAQAEEVVLVTGFEPFGGEKANPSWEVCRQLPARIAGLRVEKCLVPCEFRRSIQVVAEAIERLHPVLVVSVGQAGGRSRLGVERVAINVDDARIPDNGGAQPIDEMIAANGPPAYFSTLPVKAMAAAIRAAGVPAEVSNTAGTYVCNHLMYGVLHYLAASGGRARAGFIHVPFSERQALDKPNTPAMSLDTMVKGVAAAIAAAQAHRHDLKVSEGTLD
ncbi:MAG TPA: pyroglutamyl-peptidase I [Usitatibacter sp.]|nr:pyroglutamyl-peptidase I [Usitatibacter sp.]